MNTNANIHEDLPPAELSRARRAVRGASIGFAIDCYDIYLPVIALAPAIVYFIPKNLDVGSMALINGLVFAATLLGRPLGAVIFGNVADRLGRKKATVWAMFGSAVGTALLVALPGFQTVGFAAIVLLILMRFLTGIFLGGQYTGAVPLAMESAPRHKRGLYGGLISMGFPLAFCVVSAITAAVISATVLPDGSNPAYIEWGWRIPVAIGAIVTFAFTLYYMKSVDESPAFAAVAATRNTANANNTRPGPLRQLFTGQNARNLRQVFILMTGVWILSNATSASFPGTFRGLEGMTPGRATMIIVFYQIALIVLYPLAGALSQKIGRRRFLAINGLTGATIAPITYGLLVSNVVTTDFGYTALAIVLVATSICAFGCTGSYLSERFPSAIRSTGYGVAYSVAVILPAFYAFYESGLASIIPSPYGTIVLYVLGGALLLIGALMGPETRGANLRLPANQTNDDSARPVAVTEEIR
ncbi:MFS family permease [Arthrobacter sp. PvP023]|uniref:MFS transporter n=1 Tax=Micrococcaceae TaxID=1268 RepID=UPI001AE8BE93|nr:MFS transporter [Arthrobacter sp. PvP023]MBP1136562.1 MFS family permease [Arthrobacter sp. PvP023]